MKKITVVHIEAGRHLYGGALQVAYLLDALKNNVNVNNIVICPLGSEVAEHFSKHNECKIIPIKMKGDLDIGLTWKVKRILAQEKADILHIHSRRGADIYGGLAAKMLNIPSILTRRVDNPESRWWCKIKYRLFNQTVAISDGIRQVLLNQGLSPNQVKTVRSVVDTEHYQPIQNSAWFTDTFNVQAEHFVIGIVAQLIERKGHLVLFNALKELLKSYPQIKVLVLGRGPQAQHLKNKVAELDLQQAVYFSGFRADLEQVLPNLDVLVHPAYMEGLGVSLLQACACETPVIASAVGGIPEAIEEKVNGLLVPAGDVQALQSAIETLICNPNLRLQLAKQAREKMLNEFSIQAMANQYLNLYQKLDA